MLYIDTTGMYGTGSHEKPEFATLSDFIAELDRLGIWGAITACTVARDTHSDTGNRQLMADIAAIPGAADRIIPAFAVAPKNFYEKESMEYLHEMLSSGKVGVLAIYPRTCGFAVSHIERLFDDLAKYDPLVLVDINELNGQNDFDGLAHIAKKYPGMNFIVQNTMWGGFGALFDLMWRCPNVYAETSRMHVQDLYQTMENRLGAGRAVFGKGYRAICGAAQAALRYAGVSDEEAAQVAGKRVLSLLPNKAEAQRIAAAAREIAPQLPNTFWNEFMEGKGVTSVEIIDAHTHAAAALMNGWFIERYGFRNLMGNMVNTAKKLGITRSITSGIEALMGDCYEGNRMLERESAEFYENVSGYYVYNPIYGHKMTEEELDERFAGGFFVGIKTLADYWHMPVTDPSYTPIWEYADKHRLPILFHSWEGVCDTPDMIAEVAVKYPNAFFLIGHSGGGDIGRLQAERACKAIPNIYLEYCGSFVAKRNWRDTLDVVGADRVVFGTDTQGHDQAWELGKLLSENVTDDELKLILSENMKKILAKRI